MTTAMVLLSTWMESQVEIWMPTEYEGYDVSNLGGIRSYWDSKRLGGTAGSYSILTSTPKLRKIDTVKGRRTRNRPNRYLVIALRITVNGKRVHKLLYVHRLVAQAFIPNPNNWKEVNHKTRNRRDARVGNLEWKTKDGNVEHAMETGAYPKGEDHPCAKITADSVRAIRVRTASGEKYNPLSAEYGVSREAIHKIVKRTVWRDTE